MNQLRMVALLGADNTNEASFQVLIMSSNIEESKPSIRWTTTRKEEDSFIWRKLVVLYMS